MIINTRQLSDKSIESTTVSKKMKLSEESTAFIFQMFINNKYSNPIGSIVREITSNCFDSHIESNVNLPVVIRKEFDNDSNRYMISFIDYGVGLSPERIDKIYGVLFESTKRADNLQIGGFGIGSKSPLAYKRKIGFGSNEYDNSFFVVTNYNGTKYHYCIYEGEEFPEINLQYQAPTTERNGTEVRIPVLPQDIFRFENEIIRQLYYFENLVFEGFENNINITNNYTIINTQNFLYRGVDYSKYVHVCLGRVAYKIDYGILELNDCDYQIPIALKFNIGELGVNDSRENLDYSEKTIKILKERLLSLKKEIIGLLSKQFDGVVTLEDYFKLQKNRLTLYLTDNISIDVNCLNNDVNKIIYNNFKYKNYEHFPNSEQLFGLFFSSTIMGNRETRYDRRNNGQYSKNYESISNSLNNIYYLEEEYKRNNLKLSYLKSINSRYYILRKNEFINEVSVQKIFKNPLLSINDVSDIVNDFWELIKKYTKNYNSIVIPDSFVIERKKRKNLDGEINVNLVTSSYGTTIAKIKVQDLANFNGKIFYGTKEDEQSITSFSNIVECALGKVLVRDYNKGKFINTNKKFENNCLMFCFVAKTNIKYITNNKNAFPISMVYTKLLYRNDDKIKHIATVLKFYNKISYNYEQNHFILSNNFIKLYPNLEKSLLFCKNIISEKSRFNNVDLVDFERYDLQLDKYKEYNDGLKDIEIFLRISNFFGDYASYISAPYYPDRGNSDKFFELIKIIGNACDFLKSFETNN